MNHEMQTLDADLGYIKLYVKDLHERISKGVRVPSDVKDLIKKAHESIQSAYAKMASSERRPSE